MLVLSGLKLKELENLMEEMHATKFRAKQIHNWIYSKSVSKIDEMTNLSKAFREELKTKAVVTESKIKVKQVSSDGTIK
jgi:23S rRNA (adenine2503-C2)-methyltransferase